ncbi:MAG: 3-oxoacyl-[acyl-carrier-protein] reductase [Leptospirales bacterium]
MTDEGTDNGLSLSGQVALVTGAARGIGWAVAIRLLKEGAEVWFGVRKVAPELESAISLLPGANRAHLLPLDVSDPVSIDEGMDRLLNRSGRIDILVNNAGIVRDGLLVRMKDEDFQDVLATNLMGPFRLMRKAVKPMMKERYGRIVSVSSVVGTTGNAGQANYAASKGGLVALSKSLALEVASRGITVNVVAPGFIETDMTDVLPEKVREAALGHIPVGRFGKAEEIAHSVCYLVSREAGFVTGQTLHVNGGMALV